MRLRNIPRAGQVLEAHDKVVKEYNRGGWRQQFGNGRPIHIEIGMGKGKFLLELARRNPLINYIGIERYSSVLLRAAERYDRVVREGETLDNIRFICMDAREIEEAFAPGEAEKIYLNFSDPWPKKRHADRRLTSEKFLLRYEKILVSEGMIELKTDNRDLFSFSMEQVKKAGWELVSYTWDLYRDEAMCEGNVMTEYEEKFAMAGNPICKLTARRKAMAHTLI